MDSIRGPTLTKFARTVNKIPQRDFTNLLQVRLQRRVRRIFRASRAARWLTCAAMKRDIASYRARLQDRTKAEQYANRFERGSRRRIDRREQRAVRRIFKSLPDCRSVLDAPCGAGRFLPTLAQCCSEVMGADISPEILEFARHRTESAGVPARLFQGDASQLPLPDNAVDAVFCNRLLHHIVKAEERAKILRELCRVARRYVVVSFFDYQAFGALRRFLKRLKGSKPNYKGQPTLAQFGEEAVQAGFGVREVVPTGPLWVSEKYFVLAKR
jgi:ubiquinone/menaquinone biosynthesis C-methylase UbiE